MADTPQHLPSHITPSDHDAPAHPKHLAHHFDTPQQQFDSGKLGIWLFLTTEILLFSGLFCAYSVYRANHPEIFEYAHHYLDKTWGGINTLVLIFSSLTMAWGVRCAQLSQKRGLIICLILTLLCACGFLGIKFVEYKAKFEHHTLWGDLYKPTMPLNEFLEEQKKAKSGSAAVENETPVNTIVVAAPVVAAPLPPGQLPRTADHLLNEQSVIPVAAIGPAGINPAWADATNKPKNSEEWEGPEPYNVHIFFSIYFVMTGLHGIHVLAGMAVIGWCLMRAIRGDFDKDYFAPVDFAGLYWHLVDLIWIFLFPLLYLIQ